MKTLRDVKVGEHAVIQRLHGEGALKRRIMDMGLDPRARRCMCARWRPWATPWS